jgi:hypothetical protein
LISNRTLSGQNSADSSLTIGADNLARVYVDGIMGYNNDELVVNHNQLADQIYKNLTGWDPGNSACLLVNLPEIVIGMSLEKVDTFPGAMGENLRRTVYVLGNGNTMFSHPSVTIGMDSKRRVPLGDVGPNT